MGPQQSCHLSLSVAELRGKVTHQSVIVEEARGEVEERLRVRGSDTVLNNLLGVILQGKITVQSHLVHYCFLKVEGGIEFYVHTVHLDIL